jgi:hypothetical protein
VKQTAAVTTAGRGLCVCLFALRSNYIYCLPCSGDYVHHKMFTVTEKETVSSN